jgi:hypothetical protein
MAKLNGDNENQASNLGLVYPVAYAQTNPTGDLAMEKLWFKHEKGVEGL